MTSIANEKNAAIFKSEKGNQTTILPLRMVSREQKTV